MARISDLIGINNILDTVTVGSGAPRAWFRKTKKRVNLLALGDVGSTLLLGLRLLGAEAIESIGITDVRPMVPERFEFEMNQIAAPDGRLLPPVRTLAPDEWFDCDAFLFCASKGVPDLSNKGDVRMAQLEANSGLVSSVAANAVKAGFKGLFCVVSDPVDPLCMYAASAGLHPDNVKGFGLGVMNARAAYFAGKDARLASYLTEGRAYGPHGGDLVIANSIENYDDALSGELTELTVKANIRMREWGFKPYIAPAISSGAFSVIAAVSGEWHYSSVNMDGVWLGCRNRVTDGGTEIEDPVLPEELYARIKHAYDNLKELRNGL